MIGARRMFFGTTAWWAVMVAVATAAELVAGIGVADITPPVPFRMSGYFQERLSTGVKDRLQAKAIVFRQGDESAALVFCDLIGIPLEVSDQARAAASKQTGIPAAHIVVAATHTHTGPLYFDALRNHFHARSIERLGHDPAESIDYPRELVDKIVAAVAEAQANLQPIELTSFSAVEPRLSFNRRFHMRDGAVRFNPGQLNAEIVRAAGPIDPEVGVVLLRRPAAAEPLLGAIVSFALHLDTVGGTEYSADYPKHCEDRLREEWGAKSTLLFGAGTCGDVNHIDVTTRDTRKAPEIGRLLAETILQGLRAEQPQPPVGPALAVRSAKVEAPLQKYSASEVAAARKNMDLIGSRQLPFLEQVEAYKITNLQLKPGDTLPLEVQVFRLDDRTAIVTLPGEVFVELGLAIKQASPFETTLIVELANHSMGYIPTRRAFAEGSYETVNSQVEPGGGEQIVETTIGLLKELQ